MTELHWGESTISLHGCSADRLHHQNNNKAFGREEVILEKRKKKETLRLSKERQCKC
jgi:hypothetical protein